MVTQVMQLHDFCWWSLGCQFKSQNKPLPLRFTPVWFFSPSVVKVHYLVNKHSIESCDRIQIILILKLMVSESDEHCFTWQVLV